MDGFWTVLGAGAILALLWFAITGSIEADRQFEAQMADEYSKCIMAKESEYTCKAYISSLRAQRSADGAETAAYIGIGLSAASSSNKR